MHDHRANWLRAHATREEVTQYGNPVLRIYIDGSWQIARQIAMVTGGKAEYGANVAAVDGGRWTQRVNIRSLLATDVEEILGVLETLLTIENVLDVEPVLAIDFYKVVQDGVEPMHWPNTEIGELVNMAKYHQDEEARRELADRLGAAVRSHALLRGATLVASVPDSGKATSIGRGLARGVAERLGVPHLEVIEPGEHLTAKGAGPGERASLVFEIPTSLSGQRVLIVDDVLRRGETMSAAGNALRRAGAFAVSGLVATRTVSG